jgi:hypothetical protein
VFPLSHDDTDTLYSVAVDSFEFFAVNGSGAAFLSHLISATIVRVADFWQVDVEVVFNTLLVV